MINTDKLLSEMEGLKKAYPVLHEFIAVYREDDNEYWKLSDGDMQNHFDAAIDMIKDVFDLVKKHCEGAAEEPQKGCWSCKHHIAGRGCYKTCNSPVWEAWQPKPTAEVDLSGVAAQMDEFNEMFEDVFKRLRKLEGTK